MARADGPSYLSERTTSTRNFLESRILAAPMSLTRRNFLERVAAVGGATMVYDSMTAIGLLGAPADTRFDLRGQVSGVRDLVLGAGLAGLTVAYELGKLGYQCQVLEARARPGGRAYTVRRGTISEEDGSTQVCAFDEGLYFNPGPMRIPHHHSTTLAYCRELRVPLEVFAVNCDSAYLYQAGAGSSGRRVRIREARTDLDGYVAELLSKAVSDEALNQPLTREDREHLLEYLRRAGALDEQSRYHGSPRRGYGDLAGARDGDPRVSPPLPLSDLLGERFGWYLQSDYSYQATMLQVAGGTDRLPAALAARLDGKIQYGVAAREIRHTADGVSVVYEDRSRGMRQTDADYCVCTLPLTCLATLQTDFAPERRRAIAAVSYASAGKMGLQFKRRFWEQDDGIYGGITRTDQEIEQIVYPSAGFLGRKGVLVGYYTQRGGRPMGERTPAERQAAALEQGGRIHPQYRTEFENGFSVAWHRVPWSRGSWATFSIDARREALPLLLEPDRRVYLAGDYLTRVNAWMEGAFESARSVATAIHTRVSQTAPV